MRQLGELCRKIGKLGPARARAADVEIVFHIAVLHIAGLGHEAVDHPVKGHVVIGTGAGQFLHPRGVFRRDVGQKLDCDGAVLEFHQDGVFGVFDIGHCAFLSCFGPLHKQRGPTCQAAAC